MVIYFTGTGNSRYCAELLADELNDEILDSSGYIKHGIAADLISGKPWVFVCPVYAWQMPEVFKSFIRTGSFNGERDAYFVLTCGGDIGNAENGIMEVCASAGLRFRGVLETVMPENYVAMFSVPGEREAEKIVDGAEIVLKKGAENIKKGLPFPARSVGMFDRLKSGPVNRGFNKYYVSAKAFRSTEKCVGCGKCVELCPLNNIELVGGRPIWSDNCTHCMACICRCPAEAIEYGKRSVGKRRYVCREYKK